MDAAFGLLVTLLYLIPVALLALILTTERRPTRRAMAVLLACLPLFYLGHYLLWQRAEGWPSDAPLPEAFRLIAFQINEPDTRSQAPGSILMWVSTPDDPEPRVHRLAYEKRLHQALTDAGRKTAAGVAQIGRRERSPGTASTGAPGVGGDVVRFENAPRPRLPPKSSASQTARPE